MEHASAAPGAKANAAPATRLSSESFRIEFLLHRATSWSPSADDARGLVHWLRKRRRGLEAAEGRADRSPRGAWTRKGPRPEPDSRRTRHPPTAATGRPPR